MTTGRTKAAVVAGAAILSATTALSADEWIVRYGGTVDAAAAETACAADPAACDARVTGRITAALLYLAEIRSAEVYPLARLAADLDAVSARVAAAEALGAVLATAEDTPVLAELADDPVPAVRTAALQALARSNDERARTLAARAERFGSPGATELDTESAEAWPALTAMGVAMPADARFLHFASDRARGRYVWISADPAAKILGRLSGKGKGPFTPDEYEALLAREDAENSAQADALQPGEDGMPSAEQMMKAMEMAQQAMAAMNETADQGAEAQAAAVAKAMGQNPGRDGDLGERYRAPELFGDPRLVLMPVAGSTDAVVAVYSDLLLGATGIAVHRSPVRE